jgi:DNA-directed RNA polymerase subunit RPC12/RpoP
MAQKDDGYVRFRCRSCGQKLKVRRTYEGGNVVPCPRCGTQVNVPLANLEAIAEGADMPETGQPGRINVDPDLLMKRLRGEDEQRSGPGSVGGAPTLREAPWSPDAAFGRIKELDQLGAALAKLDGELIGEFQRIYRNKELQPREREEQVRDAAEGRAADQSELLANRLAALRRQMRSLETGHERLNRSELQHLERLKRAQEAIRLYGRHVLGLEDLD